MERFTWGLAQSDVKLHEMGKKLQEDWRTNVRPQHLNGLAEIGQSEDAMSLAESYKDMPTLASLVWGEIGFIEEARADASTKMRQAECHVKLDKMKERIHRYFEEFGASWATAFYTKWIETRQAERIFWKDYMNQAALTKFLRSSPALGKLAWINEISGEQNYEAAHDELVNVAANRETNAWCRKVELSIAKLSLLSTREKGREVDDAAAEEIGSKLEQTQARLSYAKIQDLLYERLAPTVSEALDGESAVQLLMAQFGGGRLEKRPAHQHLLKQGFEALVQHQILDPALLIDVLTLMTYEESNDRTDDLMKGNEFAFALNALLLSWNDHTNATRESLLDLIWKRACLKDDWASFNKTAKDMSDAELRAFLVADTTVGWTLKTLHSMINDDPFNRNASPRHVPDLIGTNTSHGELCTRFATEDLRTPIIDDNVKDDEDFKDAVKNHRLDDWFKQAEAAAKAYLEEEARAHHEVQSLDTPPPTPPEHEVSEIDGETGEKTYASVLASTEDVDMRD